MNRGSLKTRFISEVDGDDSENLQKNCYVALSGSGVVQGRAPCFGGVGAEQAPHMLSNGRPTNKSELKIRVRPDFKWKKFWTTKIFSAYNHNNIPHEVTHGDIFVLQLVPCGGRDICTSRKSSPPHLFRLERRELRRLKRIDVSTTIKIL